MDTLTKKAEKIYTENRIQFCRTQGIILKFVIKGDTYQKTKKKEDLIDVHYNRLTKEWDCTCMGFSIRHNPYKDSHIRACMLYVQYHPGKLGL